MGSILDEEGGRDPAIFSHQDVVGAARCLRIHDLESDPRVRKGPRQSRMRKPLAIPCTEQNHFGLQISQSLKIAHFEGLEAFNRPRLDPLGRHNDVGGMTHPIDLDEAWAVRSNGLLSSRRVGVQLQIARDLKQKIKRVFEYIIGTPYAASDV